MQENIDLSLHKRGLICNISRILTGKSGRNFLIFYNVELLLILEKICSNFLVNIQINNNELS
jgi:hypothetical protein